MARAALLGAGIQFGALLAFGAICVGGALLADSANYGWGGMVIVPAALAYAPLVVIAMPTQFGGYRDTRRSLSTAGATRAEARATSWAEGPFAFLGLLALCAAVFAVFA